MTNALKELVEGRLSELGLNPFKAAKMVGLERGFINDILQGKKQMIRKASVGKLASALQVNPGRISEAISQDLAGTSMASPHVAGLAALVLANDPRILAGAADVGVLVPVYRAVEGGPGVMIIEKEAIDHVPRPEPLRGVKESYLVEITGDCMIPEFWPGERAIVNPKAARALHEPYIFYTNNPEDHRATIKRLVKNTADTWSVVQWNPAKEFALNRGEWPVCHRVVGKYARQ